MLKLLFTSLEDEQPGTRRWIIFLRIILAGLLFTSIFIVSRQLLMPKEETYPDDWVGPLRMRIYNKSDMKVVVSGIYYASPNGANGHLVEGPDTVHKRKTINISPYRLKGPVPNPKNETVFTEGDRFTTVCEILSGDDFNANYEKDKMLYLELYGDPKQTDQQVKEQLAYAIKVTSAFALSDSSKAELDIMIRTKVGSQVKIAFQRVLAEEAHRIARAYRKLSFEQKVKDWLAHTLLSPNPQRYHDHGAYVLSFPIPYTNPNYDGFGFRKVEAITNFYEQFLLPENTVLKEKLETHFVGPYHYCFWAKDWLESTKRGKKLMDFYLDADMRQYCPLHPTPLWIFPMEVEYQPVYFPFFTHLTSQLCLQDTVRVH